MPNRWMDKEAVVQTVGYYSAMKRNAIWVSSNEVDEPKDYYTDWSNQKQKNKYYILTHIYEI